MKKILLVDDDPQIQKLYNIFLKNAGFAVVSARDGQEGLAMTDKEKPDLIILDVMMPVMDGTEMLLKLRQNPAFKNIPALMFSSLANRPEDIKFAQEAGAVDFINKDIDVKILIAKIKQILKIPG